MKRHERRRQASEEIARLFQNDRDLRFIHYSCESFRDRDDGSSPRVTSIAVGHSNGQARSFSIHQVAEREGALDLIEDGYDKLERTMLTEFFDFVRSQPDGTNWIHWNMRDTTYGFAAIEHRYRVIGGTIPDGASIRDTDKTDLSMLLLEMFGGNYIPHQRLENLAKRNDLTMQGFMGGPAEATAFEDGEYAKLHQSTLRKAHLILDLAKLAASGELRTDAGWRDRHGASLVGALDALFENTAGRVLATLATAITVIGAVAALALWVWRALLG